MSQHPSDELLEGFRHGALEPATAGELDEHLTGCEGCRERLAAEARFDRELHRGLSRETAPPALQERVRAALAAEVASRSGRRRRRVWIRGGLAAAALAVAALGLFALEGGWLGPPGGQQEPAAAGRLLQGQLVCIGCARHDVPVELHARCERPGDPEHATGLRTPDGNLWRFADAGTGEPLLHDRLQRGAWVEVEARPYPEIGFLGVSSIRRL